MWVRIHGHGQASDKIQVGRVLTTLLFSSYWVHFKFEFTEEPFQRTAVTQDLLDIEDLGQLGGIPFERLKYRLTLMNIRNNHRLENS